MYGLDKKLDTLIMLDKHCGNFGHLKEPHTQIKTSHFALYVEIVSYAIVDLNLCLVDIPKENIRHFSKEDLNTIQSSISYLNNLKVDLIY